MTRQHDSWRDTFIPRGVVGIVLLSAVLAWTVSARAKERIGETVVTQIASPHPYPNGDVTLPVVWTETVHHPGAQFLKIHFSQFALGSGDRVRLLDADHRLITEYTDQENARGPFWAVAVVGDSLTIELRADAEYSGDGVMIDRYGYGEASLMPESICSGDQKEDVACYAGTPLATASRAVGRMLFEERGVLYACTGFLVSDQDHFMSNEHCISSQEAVESLEVTFDYEHTSCGGTELNPSEAFVGGQLILAHAAFDVALMTLQGRPSEIYGFLPLSDREPRFNEPLYIPQHPSGDVKQVSVMDCRVSSPVLDGDAPGSDFGHQCDTQNGSSGSPVLDMNHQVVGLHHLGGCGSGGGENQAVLMSRILPLLPPMGRDFAITDINAPKRITLTKGRPKTALVKVQIQNRGALAETISDVSVLNNLVHLQVESLGACPAPVATLLGESPQKTLPVTLKSKQKLNVVFAVSFACADSLESADFRYSATVNRAALDGKSDDHPDDDMCPRDASKPFAFDLYPDGKIKEKGCGEKKPDGSFGADVGTAVIIK